MKNFLDILRLHKRFNKYQRTSLMLMLVMCNKADGAKINLMLYTLVNETGKTFKHLLYQHRPTFYLSYGCEFNYIYKTLLSWKVACEFDGTDLLNYIKSWVGGSPFCLTSPCGQKHKKIICKVKKEVLVFICIRYFSESMQWQVKEFCITWVYKWEYESSSMLNSKILYVCRSLTSSP